MRPYTLRTPLAVLLAGAPIASAQLVDQPLEAVPHEPPPIDLRPPFRLPDTPRTSPGAIVRRGLFESVQVNTDADGLNILGDAANEPSIAPNELDPANIVIAWRQFDTINSDFRQAGQSFSWDRGRTWSGTRVLDPGVFRSDPVVRAGPDGELYLSSLRIDPGYVTDIFRSEDGGDTWLGPYYSLGGDKQWISVDLTDGPGRGMVYQHWDSASPFGRKFSRSFDRGGTWDDPADGSSDWGQETTLPDGSVCIAPGKGKSIINRLVGTYDPDSPPTVESSTATQLRPGGFSLLHSINPGGLIGQGNVSSDHSDGPTRGNIYALGTGDYDDSKGVDYNVAFARSTDTNLTYSTPVFVHSVTVGHQWFGTMSVAANGRIDVVWNDTRNDPVDPWNPTTSELFYTCSIDAGETWLPEIPVSPPFEHLLGFPQQNKLGDYYDAHSDSVGMDVAYAATFNGEQDVYYLRIGTADCNQNGIPDEAEIAMGLAQDDDGDGRIDACACIADFNADGTVDSRDVLAFLNAWATERTQDCSSGECLTDLDENGVVDTRDVLAFLNAWSAGC
ncbi:MAG: hypothetical protein IPJ41_00275 [Phycisphaerales bacterium]|nr:hypothetical protein [Phycisphaerales bacterium]